MAYSCSLYIMCSDWLIVEHCFPIMPKDQLPACKNKKPNNKQLINLKHSVFMGKSQTLALLY